MGMGEPLYHIERYVLESDMLFGDDAHIIYVNGTYRGDDPLGRLMADFNCTEPSKMYYNVLKSRTGYFKETREGVAIMCKAIEDMRNQEREEGRTEGRAEGRAEGRTVEIFSSVQEGDYSAKRGAEKLGISVDEFEKRMTEAGYQLSK